MATRKWLVVAVFGVSILGAAARSSAQPANVEPGTMWVLLNHVKADQRQAFEAFAFERLLPALKKAAATDPLLQKVHSQTRMLVPKEANSDGTYTYIWLMDPVVPGADYSYESIIGKAFSKEQTDSAIALMQKAMASPQVGYVVSSSPRW